MRRVVDSRPLRLRVRLLVCILGCFERWTNFAAWLRL